jgi:hypothetical protein
LVFYFWALFGFLFRQKVKNVRYAVLAYFLLTVHIAFSRRILAFRLRRAENYLGTGQLMPSTLALQALPRMPGLETHSLKKVSKKMNKFAHNCS